MPTMIKALDPDTRKLLTLAKEAGYPAFQDLSPVDARNAYAAGWAVMQSDGGEVASVKDLELPSDSGALKIRVYRGQGTDANQALPCMLFLHGGGWVIGSLESHDRLCRRLANVAQICVVAVDYRLAPEHPFPAGLHDAVTAWDWIHDHAKELHINADAVGVGGDSAGGNLAAVLAIMGREGEVIPPVYQALIYPALDLTASSQSYAAMTEDVPLTAATMHYFVNHYTPVEADRLHWKASPLRAESLQGVAPAMVMTVAHDPLCDEGRAYAERLMAEGNRVSMLHFNDHVHGLLGMGKWVPAANHIADHIFKTIGFELHRCSLNASKLSFTKSISNS